MGEHTATTADRRAEPVDHRAAATSTSQPRAMTSQQTMLALQRHAGNAAMVQRLTIQRDELLDREAKATEAVKKLSGQSAGTFMYENPNQAEYVDKPAPSATMTMGSPLYPGPDTPDQRHSFDSDAAARAFAMISRGPAGAAVVKQDTFFFVVALSTVSTSELKRENVYDVTLLPPVTTVIGTDGLVFENRAMRYTPNLGQAGKTDRPEEAVAKPADAAAMRDLVGMSTAAPGSPAKPGVAVPKEQAEQFIKTYLIARGLEALEQNRNEAVKLAEQFKPGEDGKVGGSAKDLMDVSRPLGALYEQLSAKEAEVGTQALGILDKHQDGGRWNHIVVKGQDKSYFGWMDDLTTQLQAIQKAKASVLAMSPLLASLVQHEQTPGTATGWAEKLQSERATKTAAKVGVGLGVVASIAFPPLALVAGAAALASHLSGPDPESWEGSELSKKSSDESDKKIADQFRKKLDDVQHAISTTYTRVAGGDTDMLLGYPGLTSRVEADLSRMTGENAYLVDKFRDMKSTKQAEDTLISIAGTAIQIGALFLPGGQFISAAIGLGMAMHDMDKHLSDWDTSKASVDPAKALVDQQEAVKTLLFDTINLAVSAVDMAVQVNEGITLLEEGRAPAAPKGGPSDEARDPSGKHVGDKDVPPGPTAAGKPPEGTSPVGMSKEYTAKLADLGIPGGNPYNGFDPHAVLKKCNHDWNVVKANFLGAATEKADELAGDYVMHQMTVFRSTNHEARLNKIIDELHAKYPDEARHTFEAVGSTARSSDLDYSISGPRASEVVAEFNNSFRAEFGAESGVVFDSNIYTRSAQLDFPLTPEPGAAGKIPVTPGAGGKGGGAAEWTEYEKNAIAGATDKKAMQAVLDDAAHTIPDDLRGRVRMVENFRNDVRSYLGSYQNIMAEADGPVKWKAFVAKQLDGLEGAAKTARMRALDEVARTALANDEQVIAKIKELRGVDVSVEKLHHMAHSADAAEVDMYLQARNALYSQKAGDVEKLKAEFEKAARQGDEAAKVRLAGEINAAQGDALYFASEAYQTGGSITGIVQNIQKAKGDFTSLAFGELTAAQCRQGFNEQMGYATAYGSSWPEVTKAGKYIVREESLLKAHPLYSSGGLPDQLSRATKELDALKSLPADSEKLTAWRNTYYSGAPDLKTALEQHRAALEGAEGGMLKEFNKLSGMNLDQAAWEKVAKDPNRMAQILRVVAIATGSATDD